MIKVCFKLRSGDILIIQYPLKKYYTLLCNIVHYRGAKVITLIHDLGSFRRKRLTVLQEIDRLQNSDYLITLNDSMSAWLQTKGCEVPKGELKIWDNISPAILLNKIEPATDYTVVYAGALGYDKNRFLYELDRLPRQWHLSVYGKGLEADNVIVINFFNSVLGFPNQIKEERIMRLVTKKAEDYPYSEERRLFYVAITRTRNRCYLLVPSNNYSIFIKELEREKSLVKFVRMR